MRNGQKKHNSQEFIPPTFAKKVRGFTLIEMIISVGIFVVVLSVSMGALLSMIDSNRKTQSLRSAMDNLNLAMEEMARNIGQGRTYHCGISSVITPNIVKEEQNCLSGEEHFLAIEAHSGSSANINDQFVYKLEFDADGIGRLQKSMDSGSSFRNVTAPEINLEYMKFYVFDKDIPNEPPRVVITIGGTAGNKENTQSEFNVQTTVTQHAPE